MRIGLLIVLGALTILAGFEGSEVPDAQAVGTRDVQPGDTWPALAFRYGLEEDLLRGANPHINSQRQPAIGDTLVIPEYVAERKGQFIRPGDGGLVQTGAQFALSPWAIVIQNDLVSPYLPTFYRPLILPGEGEIRDLPAGVGRLEVTPVPAAPGIALGLRGALTTHSTGETNIVGQLDGLPLAMTRSEDQFAGIVGTGAFYAGGSPDLILRTGSAPPWVQPWKFEEREWDYQELTLTGEAAEIDQQSRDEERARLKELWAQVTPPVWSTSFQTPIGDYLEVSANYGARRSYNGGPYLTYHEGVDFSAYAGTPVYAPAAGTVRLAERLYVRGGAVIIDHGLGIFSGFYHLSAVHAQAGQQVMPGDIVGEVGTTGLSTGNHLHWDLLINGIWVDPAAWQDQDLACWLLEGLDRACSSAPTG